jgi:dTDP-D-glucose 4,6-dehydratase
MTSARGVKRTTRCTPSPLRGLQARVRALHHYYHVEFALPYVALRYANVYGPRQHSHGEAGVVAIFCGNLARGKTSTINGGGEIHTGLEETLLSFAAFKGSG